MTLFTLQAFKTGGSLQSISFADEQSAYAETMRLQKSGSFDAVKLVRTDGKSQKVLFDTTGKGAGDAHRRPSKLLPVLLVGAVLMGAAIAFGVALLHHR
jgi:hypothetical protein